MVYSRPAETLPEVLRRLKAKLILSKRPGSVPRNLHTGGICTIVYSFKSQLLCIGVAVEVVEVVEVVWCQIPRGVINMALAAQTFLTVP